MDQLQTRLEALEHQMHTVNRRLRRWRGLACGSSSSACSTWALPLSTAQEEDVTRSGSVWRPSSRPRVRRLLRYLDSHHR